MSFSETGCVLPTLCTQNVAKFFPYKEKAEHLWNLNGKTASGWLSAVLNQELNLAVGSSPDFSTEEECEECSSPVFAELQTFFSLCALECIKEGSGV